MHSFNFFKYHGYVMLICLCAVSPVFGQPVNNLIGDVVMPAPNAGSLGKYGDIPVSYFTGVPSIGVPIHTVKEGNLSLPISLSYHSSGVKVGEPASWVGLGWSLNAGGMITRTVLGKPDEMGNGYYNSGEPDWNDNHASYYILHGIWDGEPDVFTFNFDGYSGKFVFDKNRQVHTIPKQDLKIVEDFADLDNDDENEFLGFKIITPDGTKYYFGRLTGEDSNVNSNLGRELTYDDQGAYPFGYSTSWYLRKIESYDEKYSIQTTGHF